MWREDYQKKVRPSLLEATLHVIILTEGVTYGHRHNFLLEMNQPIDINSEESNPNTKGKKMNQ